MIPTHLVPFDFRENLIVDPDNPVLIQKAWRDHHSGEAFFEDGRDGGRAYLGVPHGEDALTWNVFRTLQQEGAGGLRILSEAFGLSAVETVLFWGCDVAGRSDAQQLLSILLRRLDGRLKGTMTEPDVVLVTAAEVAFVECKLNLPSGGSPWKAQVKEKDAEGSGAARRMKIYASNGFPELEGVPWADTYQLIRQYVYSRGMARELGKTAAVIPLVHGGHRAILDGFYSPLRASPLNRDGVFREMSTWQEIAGRVRSSSIACRDRLAAKVDASLASAGT
jgi:hypothetical protein